MRSTTHPDLEGRCKACWFRHDWCVCASLAVHQPPVPLVLVRHWKESWRPSNTGRIAALMLAGTQVHDHGARHLGPIATRVAPDSAWLVYPPEPDTPAAGVANPAGPPPTALVVVDGSWSQARRLVRRVPGLASLPRLVLPLPEPSRVRMRRPPSPAAMSTIEAIAAAYRLLGDPALAEALGIAFDLVVHNARRQRGLQATPSGP